MRTRSSADRHHSKNGVAPNRGRLALAGLVVALTLALAPAAQAHPVVCATISYSLNGGPTQYVINNCFVPSNNGVQVGTGPDCHYVDTTSVCDAVTVSPI